MVVGTSFSGNFYNGNASFLSTGSHLVSRQFCGFRASANRVCLAAEGLTLVSFQIDILNFVIKYMFKMNVYSLREVQVKRDRGLDVHEANDLSVAMLSRR